MRFSKYDYVNRTICECLSEMRTILKCKYVNKDLLLSLIEEVQVYGTRMESALSYGRDLTSLHEKRKKLQAEVNELQDQLPGETDKE